MSDRILKFEIPVRLVSEANARGHWSRGYQRSKQQKDAFLCAWLSQGKPRISPPAKVRLTRIGPRRLDCDNLARSFKAIRDAVAARVLECDDGDPGVSWLYDQAKKTAGVPGKYGCVIQIEGAER